MQDNQTRAITCSAMNRKSFAVSWGCYTPFDSVIISHPAIIFVSLLPALPGGFLLLF